MEVTRGNGNVRPFKDKPHDDCDESDDDWGRVMNTVVLFTVQQRGSDLECG